MFVVPTVDLRMLFALVIVGIDRRLLFTINVTAHPTADWIARQVTEAFPLVPAPKYLIRDRDRAYGEAFKRRLHAMGIRDRPIAARSPWQNASAERLIGSIRRECVDHLVAYGEAHLRRILKKYADYYNGSRLICHWPRTLRCRDGPSTMVVSIGCKSSAASTINTSADEFAVGTTGIIAPALTRCRKLAKD